MSFDYSFGLSNQISKVNGIDGAKQYMLSPNSAIALFDANDDYFYIKTTDSAGFPNIRTFKFEEIENPDDNKYVSKDEFLKEMQDVKQLIQQQITKQADSPTGQANNEQPTTDAGNQ